MRDFVIMVLFFIFLFTVFYIVFSSPPPEIPNEIRVRCPPKTSKSSVGEIPTPEQITNTGYINELIYRPSSNNSIEFQSTLLEGVPAMPLNNDNICDKMSKDLPLGDINIEYLMKNNTSYI